MAAAAPFLMAGSAVVNAIGAMNAADASAANYNAQAGAAASNATIARQNAASALAVGNERESQKRRQSALLLGQQRAALLSAGIGADGSAADVIAQSTGNAELDALNERHSAALQANNYLSQGLMADAQGNAARQSAANAEDAGFFGAASSLLGGAAKIAGAMA